MARMETSLLVIIIVATLSIAIYTVVILCICIKACRRRNYARFGGMQAPVVVTSATHTAPGGYPVSQMPPQQMPPIGMPYGQPYPPPHTNMTVTHTTMPMPSTQPPPTGFQPHAAPYPPYPPQPSMSAAANMNPPSYESAVGAAGAAPYEKQSPYNPSYAQ